MAWFSKHMTQEEITATVQAAVTAATTGATLTAHMAQCEKDKAEVKADQLRMHNENAAKFDKIDKDLSRLLKVLWIAMGAGAALSVGGKELLAKLTGG
jgi:hypothetical protein